jgi:5-hydroxyisourate hydrolase
MARLSTHVLDTARGVPASGLHIELHRLADGQRIRVATAVTNADGRTSEPLVSSSSLDVGAYELTFHAGDYFRRAGQPLTTPPFLDHVVIRFGVADADGNYHVPLLLSPYGYTTYKGS